ncbi:Asp-tRNA(Asn)/Glu-tRNA(Gln) amidotransferase subunit GatB [Patescibacteria group bacterium]|nr:Asp-tRNA(Asn)/Glu-tRNA(Gln) amidotransferase subunit GatB [Patescibacteria group bacterium]
MQYDVIIGLEIHAELKTKSKMFCGCDNNAGGKEPNSVVCPICLGHPGTLPVPNKQAIEWTILTGLALDCKVNRLTKFDRKHYFYPDLPKGYQISQYDLPFVKNGKLEVDDEEVLITRIHLEEDTGKSTHPKDKSYSLVDYNRAGTPLMELVTEPVIKNAEQAKEFCQLYQQILRYLNISNADMEKGEMRCEANISLQEQGKWKYKDGEIKSLGDYKLNNKVEVKNINSFKALEKAINYEIKRQEKAIVSGEKIEQETRGWNDNDSKTVSQRKKEGAADYRYFFEPDIPPLNIKSDWLIQIREKLCELPPAKIKRFKAEYSFSQDSAEIIASDKQLADFTERVISESRAWIIATGDDWERQSNKLAKTASNWLISELFKHLNADGKTIKDIKITPENFAEFIILVHQDKVNSTGAQTILAKMYNDGGDPSDIMLELGLEQNNNSEELTETIKKVIQENPKQVIDYQKGKDALLQFFVGRVMAETKGKSNPTITRKLLIDLLKK